LSCSAKETAVQLAGTVDWFGLGIAKSLVELHGWSPTAKESTAFLHPFRFLMTSLLRARHA
jgi:hypothetical protein